MNSRLTEPKGYSRRYTWPVHIGESVVIGGEDSHIVIQSMTSTSTMDTPGSVAQIGRIVNAGGEIVRLTAQGVREAENLTLIRDGVRNAGYDVPLVADIHFNPRAASVAAARVEKVRINPGNFVDPGRVFRKIEFTDDEYQAEIGKIEEGLVPLLEICRQHHTALRIGVNHGSLSDRIMSRYGDTPAGMVESAMEFLRVCLKHDFHNVVISIKASNVVVMTETVRLLVRAMDSEDMHFPLHLGVTEAGDGEDGRIKSAVGIGSLLVDGIGDTIRVSLSEDPEFEIPVAQAIISHISEIASAAAALPSSHHVRPAGSTPRHDPYFRTGANPNVIGLDLKPSHLDNAINLDAISVSDEDILHLKDIDPSTPIVVSADTKGMVYPIRDVLFRIESAGIPNPVIIRHHYGQLSTEELMIAASVDFGSILLDGYGDAIWIESDIMSGKDLQTLTLGILQATRRRISKTEYISCPGCGRTLYDLQSTLRDIKAATSHLKGLKIGVMGCIVNGPGEMADADYGYVGAAAGKVSLYKGKECIMKNIPADQAIPSLISLIKQHGDWIEP